MYHFPYLDTILARVPKEARSLGALENLEFLVQPDNWCSDTASKSLRLLRHLNSGSILPWPQLYQSLVTLDLEMDLDHHQDPGSMRLSFGWKTNLSICRRTMATRSNLTEGLQPELYQVMIEYKK